MTNAPNALADWQARIVRQIYGTRPTVTISLVARRGE